MVTSLKKYLVRIPDADFYRRMVKCQAACPVHTDARGYVTAIARGDFERAFHIAREPNPLASLCGRICGAPCEIACRRGAVDESVSIRALKRVVNERFGPESRRRLPPGRGESLFDPTAELDASLAGWSTSKLKKLAAAPDRKTGRVALIGAGPSSLTAAHDLALLGHEVTLFEAESEPGGMIRFGVPIYRLDREVIDLEVEEILKLGVEVRYNTPVGDDPSLTDLREEYDAVYLGIGLMQGRDLDIEGHDLDGVIKAVDLLLNFNMGYQVDLGRRVIVIGGGDVAMDAARTALRLGHIDNGLKASLAETIDRAGEAAEAIHDALDVARTALRLGATEVVMVALESWEELPASDFEIEDAIEEGIQIHTRLGPNRILGKEGRVIGLETIEVQAVFDEEGRFNPRFKPGTEKQWECDSIILAIGQTADLGLLAGSKDIETSPRGLVVIDPATGATTAHKVFAGGDVAYGPRLLIDAVRDGHIAALTIDASIQDRAIEWQLETSWTALPNHRMPENWMAYQRSRIPTLPVDRRTGITQVELGYSADEGVIQGLRCLECSINTIFDGTLCILCNGCVDVCPWNCLKIVGLDQLDGDETVTQVIERYVGELPEETSNGGARMAAMIKDDTACTRCGLCADRCPTGAITMESFRFQEELEYS